MGERYANLWRLYIFVVPEAAERAAAAGAELIGYPSQYSGRPPG